MAHAVTPSSATNGGPTPVAYEQALVKYEPVLGLETHIELGTASKMFCSCSTTFGADPNTQVCPVCLAFPGSLPVVNEKAVEGAIRLGLALRSEEHTSELQSRGHLVCRLLLEKK